MTSVHSLYFIYTWKYNDWVLAVLHSIQSIIGIVQSDLFFHLLYSALELTISECAQQRIQWQKWTWFWLDIFWNSKCLAPYLLIIHRQLNWFDVCMTAHWNGTEEVFSYIVYKVWQIVKIVNCFKWLAIYITRYNKEFITTWCLAILWLSIQW